MNELLEIAIKGARAAGDEILKHYDNYDISYKDDGSPLTSADLAANDALFFWLEKSGIPICSEEKILDTSHRGATSKFWLIDPLDGTREFIARNGEFAVCVSLIDRGKPILGVIYIPVSREIFYSSGNSMIFKNDVLLKTAHNGDNTIICGNSNHMPSVEKFSANFGLNISRCGSAIKFCRLVEGNAAIYARFCKSSLWDIAAGDYLLRQNGGGIFSMNSGERFNYGIAELENDEFIALNKHALANLNSYLSYIHQNALN